MKTNRIIKYDSLKYEDEEQTFDVVEYNNSQVAHDKQQNNKLKKAAEVITPSEADSEESDDFIPNVTELQDTIADAEHLLKENKKCFEVTLSGNIWIVE